MREKTLNFLILFFLSLSIGGAFFVSGNIIENERALKFIRYAYVVPFSMTPLLLICKLVSRFFLGALKGGPLSSIESWSSIFYLILTKEAREEWENYIKEEKAR